MKGCLHERQLQAWLDGQLSSDASASVQSHLASCAACTDRARDARQVMSLVHDAWEADLPNSVPTARLLARIEEKLVSQPMPADYWWQQITLRYRKAAAAVAVLAVVVIGAGVIRFYSAAPEPAADISKLKLSEPTDVVTRVSPPSKNPRPRAAWLKSETSKHLGQTQLLLRSIHNSDDDDIADLTYERELSRELLSRNRLLRRRAEQKAFVRAEQLLNDIEPILLDIANLPAHPAVDDVRSLKELIRSQKIIAELQLYAGKSLF